MSVSDDFIMRMDSIKRGFLTSAQGATCYLRAENFSSITNSIDGTEVLAIVGAKFHTNDIPGKAINVLVTIQCQIQHITDPSTRAHTLDIVITDDTAAVVIDLVGSRPFSTPGSAIWSDVCFSFKYSLPNPGQRAFSVGLRKINVPGTNTTNVKMRHLVLEINELRAP